LVEHVGWYRRWGRRGARGAVEGGRVRVGSCRRHIYT